MFTRDPEPYLPVKPPPMRRRRLLITLGVVVTLVVALMVGRSLLQSGPAPSQDAVRPAVLPLVPRGDTCAAWGGARPSATDQIADVGWTTIGSAQAPSSPGVGPAKADPLRWCYAHTLPGALYAATNFIAQQGAAEPAVLATYLMADTPERTRIQGVQIAPPAASPPAASVLVWRGYHVITYTDQIATLDVVHQWGDQLVAAVYTVSWENGDWKLRYPSTLTFPQRIVPGLDPAYWTSWGGDGE